MNKNFDELKGVCIRTLQRLMGLSDRPEEKLEAVRELIMICEDLEDNLERESMKTKQEPKYKIKGSIINRQSGNPIPDDEPIFILRGRDMTAVDMLMFYLSRVKTEGCPTEHLHAVQKRIDQFQVFATKNPDRMKKPDTVLTQDWDNL